MALWTLLVTTATVHPLPGCYIDHATPLRLLKHQVCEVSGPCATLTHEFCGHACQLLNFSIAGVEASHQCACGDALPPTAALVPPQECNMSCTGGAGETCGGIFRMWAYNASSVGPPPPAPAPPSLDSRYILNGRVLHTGGYCCQPYCSVLPDKTWSCAMTFIPDTISCTEGRPGEHMVSFRSSDQGKTWSEFVTIEPYSNTSTANVSAYGSITARPDGSRIFALWIQNVNGIDHIPGGKPSPGFRADMLGNFVWKYSDDQGRTWSAEHYKIPVPKSYIETVNTWNGSVQVMWEVDHIKQHKGMAMFAFTKIGHYAVAPPEEMYFLVSPNLLTEGDPTQVTWDMWPHGEHGVQAIGGTDPGAIGIAEEPHITPLHAVDAYHVVFRTSQGYLGTSQSQVGDPTKPWATSTYAQYITPDWVRAMHPNASSVKHPRGPMSPKRILGAVSKTDPLPVLVCFYNNNGFGAFASHMKINDRNEMWLTAGWEINGTLLWTAPELVLYDRRRDHGHGYPDIVMDGGEYFITETYKAAPASEARTHVVDAKLIAVLLAQRTVKTRATDGLVLTMVTSNVPHGGWILPKGSLPNFATYPSTRYGLTVDLWLAAGDIGESFTKGKEEVLVNLGGGAVVVTRLANGTATASVTDSDGRTATWRTGSVCSRRLFASAQAGVQQQLSLIIDGGPKMMMWMVDGHLCDGGPTGYAYGPSSGISDGLAAGWMLFDEAVAQVGDDPAGGGTASVGSSVAVARVYNKALYTSELIGNFRAGAT